MRNQIAFARAEGRKARARLGGRSDGLLHRLKDSLEKEYGLELVPVDKENFLQGSRGELVLAEGCLYYDRHLDSNPEELLEVLAHEYCHALLHHEQFKPASQDLIRGSAFLNNGAPALSRYSPRSLQEAEASAFAAEFICPSGDCFSRWRNEETISGAELAVEFGATPSLVRLQLAEGLYEFVAAGSQAERNKGVDLRPTGEQEKAATARGVPVLVDAGPGTGKTKTLVRRVEYLVRENKVEPEKILLLTFSNEAAGELQERLQACIGTDAAARTLVSTFHGFGVVLLNLFGHHVGLEVDYSILDEICQEELISELLGTVDCDALINIKNLEETTVKVTQNINFLKDRLVSPEKLRSAIDAWAPSEDEKQAHARSRALERIFESYEREKAKRQLVDFADLIQVPHGLLQANPDLRENLRKEFPWVLVDEYQDVSRATALLLQQVCGEANPPWAVGDARQAIYRFRGAAPENVRMFARDFPGATTFQLSENYRSSSEIISVLNRMAAWLENPFHSGPVPARWKPGREISSHGRDPVVLATANNDLAERRGVGEAVRQWMSEGIPADDIAVLARRNVDVRNIAIELKKNGIRAVTSGLLTAEGSGGDLSAVLTALDHQQAIPRLVYALHGDKSSRENLNGAIRELLRANVEETDLPESMSMLPVRDLAENAWKVYRGLRAFLHSGDGWTVLCEFLFFLTPYTRDLLNGGDDVESAVRVEEILSALSLAASYRFTHPHLRPRSSRLGLAERMRDLVTQSAPGLVPPRNQSGAVRVMTCHASKGLEFPCVAVVGQSLSEIRDSSSYLPPSLRSDPNEDLLQAESLLFVGVSRAERSALISSAVSASGRPRSKARRVPALLEKFNASKTVPTLIWSAEASGDEEIRVDRIWGGDPPRDFSTYSLGKDTCRVRTYLEDQLGARFRGRERSLYPEFIQIVRRTLRRIVECAIESGKSVSEAEAIRIAEEEWPADRQKDHAHLAIYRPRVLRWARMFTRIFAPSTFGGATLSEESFECPDGTGNSRTIKLQLIAQFQDGNGERYAIALQVGGSAGPTDSVKWSDLKDYERLPFVLLQERHGSVESLVFFGEEGRMSPFQWSKKKPQQAILEQAQSARDTMKSLSSGEFCGKLSDWVCDRCPCRTICPGWLGAIRTQE
jgi:DNA helicase-2/ATP-dependent DNA helicase PcrA